MSSTVNPILKALFTPSGADEFLARYWPRRSFVLHGDPARLPSPLRAKELSSVEALARCYRGSLRFTHGRKSERMVQIDRIEPAILYGMDLTLQFEDIVPYVPGTRELLQALEVELGLNEGALCLSAFASPKTDGLGCHYDAQDLISIQLHGTKRFHYAPMREIPNPYGTQYVAGGRPFDELFPQTPNGFPDNKNVTFETAEMQPGTVLFLPRGTWHYTEAGTPSLSLSIMINPPSAANILLDQLNWLLLQDSDWRLPLYGARADGSMQEVARRRAAQLLSQLPGQLASLSPEDLIQAMHPLSDRLRHVTSASRFQKAPNALLEVSDNSSPQGTRGIRICLDPHTPNSQHTARMEISPEALAIFQWIDGRAGVFTVGELQAAFPKFAFEELKKLLLGLAQAQYIRILWFAPLTQPEKTDATRANTTHNNL